MLSLAGCNSQIGQQFSQDFAQLKQDFSTEWGNLRSELSNGTLFSDGYLKEDGTDVCAEQRLAMAESGKFFDTKLVQAAVAGAAVGGILAVATGENVLVGAAVGGGVALAGTYLLEAQADGLNGSQIANKARGDISTENKRIDKLIDSFDDLSNCRKREAAAIQSKYNAGDLSRNDAEAQMASVRARFGEDRAKFKSMAERISQNSDNYAAVYNDIAADSGGRALEVREYKAQQQSATVTNRPATKVAGTEEGSLTAPSSDVDKLQEDCLTNVQKRDDCFERVEMSAAVEGEMTLGDDLG